ncbi:MAG: aldolase/citrate lyase family protein [Acutalibacteraceae bacterium]|nr:aldolase/citrate lyase family protein [Acutalibacteraceae bacterium]
MALKLMYITNKPEIASIIDELGVNRVFLDLEINGKDDRQGHLDTVISRHSIDDVSKLRSVIKNGELLVRCNPIFEGSKEEIDRLVNDGADIIMLPYFKTVEEVKTFVKLVDGRVKTDLLFETPQAVELVDEILNVDGIDEVHIGLNDLHLGYGLTFMFELFANGIVDKLCEAFKKHNIPYGIGGIAALGKGALPAEFVIAEHYRLGSTCAILSRSFCNLKDINDSVEFRDVFSKSLVNTRNFENKLLGENQDYFEQNRELVCKIISKIVKEIKAKNV